MAIRHDTVILHLLVQDLPRDWAEMRVRGENWETMQAMECGTCSTEISSKHRVAVGPSDPDFYKAKFMQARMIVANNDAKYDINKGRANHFGEHMKECPTWCQAEDTPTQQALILSPGLPAKKMQWLNRHDKECGKLYGISRYCITCRWL